MKEWSLLSLLYTDIFYRAIPWANLIIESEEMPKGLNFQRKHLVSSFLAGLLVALGIFFFLEYKLFSFIPTGALFYYLKFSGVSVFLGANFFVFYMRMTQLLTTGRHLRFLLPTLFFVISGFGFTIGVFIFFNHKFLAFVPNTTFYHHLKFIILIGFSLANFIVFYLKIPQIRIQHWQRDGLIRIFFIVMAGIVVTLSLFVFHHSIAYNLIHSAAASYFCLILITINILLLNSQLYRFFFNLKGFRFLLLAIFFHMLYYLYSGGTFTFCWFIHSLKRLRPQEKIAN